MDTITISRITLIQDNHNTSLLFILGLTFLLVLSLIMTIILARKIVKKENKYEYVYNISESRTLDYLIALPFIFTIIFSTYLIINTISINNDVNKFLTNNTFAGTTTINNNATNTKKDIAETWVQNNIFNGSASFNIDFHDKEKTDNNYTKSLLEENYFTVNSPDTDFTCEGSINNTEKVNEKNFGRTNTLTFTTEIYCD